LSNASTKQKEKKANLFHDFIYFQWFNIILTISLNSSFFSSDGNKDKTLFQKHKQKRLRKESCIT